MILVVAPYSPAGSNIPNLGAARKIEIVISALAKKCDRLVLLNTAHDDCTPKPAEIRERNVAGILCTEISLRSFKSRQLGKLYQIIRYRDAIGLIQKIGIPNFVWTYNGYAMESLVGKACCEIFGSKAILELEDWHFSRDRGLSPKPLLDGYLSSKYIAHVSAATVVNNSLTELLLKKRPGLPIFELPGLVDSQMFCSKSYREPFSNSHDKMTHVGYFGGLSQEKGADLLLEAIAQAPDSIHWHICGTGELHDQFELAHKENPQQVTFLSGVKYSRMLTEVFTCDVLINPHKTSPAFLNGIFPSKVLEGLASRRLYISTELPQLSAKEVLLPIRFFDGQVNNLLREIGNAKRNYQESRRQIEYSAKLIEENYSDKVIGRVFSQFSG